MFVCSGVMSLQNWGLRKSANHHFQILQKQETCVLGTTFFILFFHVMGKLFAI